MIQRPWLEQFNQQLQGLDEFHQASGSTLSLLGYAFDQQRIAAEDYLTWAVGHYQIPRLQKRFFTEAPPSEKVFARWAGHYRWSLECFPVGEWEGSPIIACLEPPQDFPANPQPIFVLADFESMKEFWEHSHSKSQTPVAKNSESATEVIAETETPEGMDLAATAAPSKQKADSFSFDDLDVSSIEKEPASNRLTDEQKVSEATLGGGELLSKVEEDGGLTGLFTDAPVVQLTPLNGKEPSAPTEATPSSDVAATTPTPPLQPTQDSLQAHKAPSSLLQKVDSKPVTVAEPVLSDDDAPLEDPVTAAKARGKDSAKMPPPPPPAKTPTIPPPPAAAAIAPKVIAGGKPNLSSSVDGSLFLEKWKKKHSSQISEKVADVFAHMKEHFQKSLVMTLDENETQVAAFAWDDSFKDVEDTSKRLPLKTPSIFNIVASTQKPFHGYISPNEINDSFFANWNNGKTPEHITISPILVDEKLVGMLVGLGEKSAYTRQVLNSTEKLCHDFSEKLKDLKVA